MSSVSAGIDFGTTNSAVAVSAGGAVPRLVSFDGKPTIPSALFSPDDKSGVLFGEQALQAYLSGREGRFMRSLKRVLGTDLMTVGTTVNGRPRRFENILAQFVSYLKNTAENNLQTEISKVVMGRPVHFRDNDAAGDARAENELENIARSVGFKEVCFQYEPIAAAFAHEAELQSEKLACVADIGGGTSDFALVRLGPGLSAKNDRRDDILSSSGVRIGGNDFDRDLSLCCFMPSFGYRTTYGPQNLFVPSSQYFELAEWSRINAAYTYKNLKIVNEVLANAHQPELYARLRDILLRETGHKILNEVEQVKIALTDKPEVGRILDYVAGKPEVKAVREAFDASIGKDVGKISASLRECLKLAAVKAEDVGLVILTGGSTEIPLINQTVRNIFTCAAFSSGNKLSSVGLGLAYDSRRRFA